MAFPLFEPKPGIHSEPIVGVFREEEGDWSGGNMELLGGHSCLPCPALGLGHVGKGGEPGLAEEASGCSRKVQVCT